LVTFIQKHFGRRTAVSHLERQQAERRAINNQKHNQAAMPQRVPAANDSTILPLLPPSKRPRTMSAVVFTVTEMEVQLKGLWDQLAKAKLKLEKCQQASDSEKTSDISIQTCTIGYLERAIDKLTTEIELAPVKTAIAKVESKISTIEDPTLYNDDRKEIATVKNAIAMVEGKISTIEDKLGRQKDIWNNEFDDDDREVYENKRSNFVKQLNDEKKQLNDEKKQLNERLNDKEKRLDDEKKQLNERLNELISELNNEKKRLDERLNERLKQHGQASGMLLISYFVIVNVSRTRLSVDYYDCVTPPDVFMELPSATVSWKLRPK
jgi:hypothetical protein